MHDMSDVAAVLARHDGAGVGRVSVRARSQGGVHVPRRPRRPAAGAALGAIFRGHEGLFSVYVHAPPGMVINVSNDSPFYRRQIPSQETSWGSVTLMDAEKRLLANALLDFSNERFVLLSESCIPVQSFPTVYGYLTGSRHSFVEIYYNQNKRAAAGTAAGWRRDITLPQWRKGSQWFELSRDSPCAS
ncbi:hypothetical protein GUJ93_ZPchr0001g31733 [Zizania palustris]|uniref:Uncharacterized protein n=1 Tax=Zizania palustris TaxID=103762 RepID=A0A8J5V8P0_ZIZPA|nr:hypothetical protein GUJ93_ZPchr0001g31733 [Zizania palustris]